MCSIIPDFVDSLLVVEPAPRRSADTAAAAAFACLDLSLLVFLARLLLERVLPARIAEALQPALRPSAPGMFCPTCPLQVHVKHQA